MSMSSYPEGGSGRLMEAQSSRNEDWNTVQKVVMSLFQHKAITPSGPIDLYDLNCKLLNLMKTDIAPFLGAYYQEQLLKRGMIVMRETVREENAGQALLNHLGEVWTRFLSSILPTLQAIFYPLQTSSSSNSMSIRNMSLLSFRDIIVLKLPLEESISMNGTFVPPSIVQMLLVLSSVRDFRENNPSERYLKLEELIALAVSPFLKPATMLKKQAAGDSSPLTKRQTGSSKTLPRGSVSVATLSGHTDGGESPIQRGKTFSSSHSPPVAGYNLEAQRQKRLRSRRERSADSDLTTLREQRSFDSEHSNHGDERRLPVANGQAKYENEKGRKTSPALARARAEQSTPSDSSSYGDDTVPSSPLVPLHANRSISMESTGSGPVPQTPDSPISGRHQSDLDSPDVRDQVVVTDTAFV